MASNPPLVRIGARGSPLSLAQTRTVQAMIAAALGRPDAPDEVAPITPIVTTGDRVQDRRLLEIGGKGLFTKEIEQALLEGRIDCAVHSLKDMPSDQPQGLVLAACPQREDPRDAFLSPIAGDLMDLPRGAKLAAASLRRQAQCLRLRPDLSTAVMRGNIDTRISKLARGEADAILLAMSGLKRLGLSGHVRALIDPWQSPPAPGQGALAIQTRSDDVDAPWVLALRHIPTMVEIAAERAALKALDGSCRTALGAHARLEGGSLRMIVEALTDDGTAAWRFEGTIEARDQAAAASLGRTLGEQVRAAAGDRLGW